MRETGTTPQPLAAPQAQHVTITVDGKTITVPAGSLVIKACEQAQSPVPFYCYHPGLSIAGNCRICLVEIEGQRKLQIACNTRVTDGMSIKTTSDPVLDGRRNVLEYLLINHPLDCPVCDQAGECWLQDYYMEHGLYNPKFNEQKHKKPKMVPLGPTVMLDAERCILCSRCVRFTDEISQTGEFGIFNRGDHAEIGLHPGKTLENNYSGNVVDVCPVGALTDRDFRFKCRVWYLGATPSVCPGCSRGCNITIQDNRERDWRRHIAQGQRVMRLKPRYNPDVNQWWMCDEGRYGYGPIDQHRLITPQLKERGQLREATWDEAMDRIVESLEALQASQAMDRVGAILSSRQTNENLYAAKQVFSALGVPSDRIAFVRPRRGASDALLMQADKSPNARGAQALGIAEGAQPLLKEIAAKRVRVLFAFTEDLVDVLSEARVKEAVTHLERFIYLGTNANRTVPLADLVLPVAVYAEQEGTFANVDGRVQHLDAALEPLGGSRPEWRVLAELSTRMKLGATFTDAPSLFAELAQHEAAFQGLTYQALGGHGAMLRP